MTAEDRYRGSAPRPTRQEVGRGRWPGQMCYKPSVAPGPMVGFSNANGPVRGHARSRYHWSKRDRSSSSSRDTYHSNSRADQTPTKNLKTSQNAQLPSLLTLNPHQILPQHPSNPANYPGTNKTDQNSVTRQTTQSPGPGLEDITPDTIANVIASVKKLETFCKQVGYIGNNPDDVSVVPDETTRVEGTEHSGSPMSSQGKSGSSMSSHDSISLKPPRKIKSLIRAQKKAAEKSTKRPDQRENPSLLQLL